MIDPEEIKTRYTRTEMAEDAMGRIITVGRIKPGLLTRISDMVGEVSRPMFVLVASVRKIDDDHISFAKSRGELEAVMDRLDMEGMEAANSAFNKLMGYGESDTQSKDGVEAAKNS